MTLGVPLVSCRLVREAGYDERQKIRCSDDAYKVLAPHFEELDREQFVVLLLNTQNEALGVNVVSIGILDASLVHPREVFKPAVLASAASVIVAHNHPSGDPTPTAEDRAVTRQLRLAGEVLGIDMLDSIVIGDRGRYVSLAEQGLLDD